MTAVDEMISLRESIKKSRELEKIEIKSHDKHHRMRSIDQKKELQRITDSYTKICEKHGETTNRRKHAKNEWKWRSK